MLGDFSRYTAEETLEPPPSPWDSFWSRNCFSFLIYNEDENQELLCLSEMQIMAKPVSSLGFNRTIMGIGKEKHRGGAL